MIMPVTLRSACRVQVAQPQPTGAMKVRK